MLPTAFRSFRVGSLLARSLLPATVDSLCDPLQRLVDPDRLIYYSQRNTINSSCSLPPIVASAYLQNNQTAGSGVCILVEQSESPTRQSTNLQLHQRRWRTDQPAVKSDDIVTYEGPLKQAVQSLKVRARSFYCVRLPIMLSRHTWHI